MISINTVTMRHKQNTAQFYSICSELTIIRHKKQTLNTRTNLLPYSKHWLTRKMSTRFRKTSQASSDYDSLGRVLTHTYKRTAKATDGWPLAHTSD